MVTIIIVWQVGKQVEAELGNCFTRVSDATELVRVARTRQASRQVLKMMKNELNHIFSDGYLVEHESFQHVISLWLWHRYIALQTGQSV